MRPQHQPPADVRPPTGPPPKPADYAQATPRRPGEKSSQRITREWMNENGIGVDGMEVAWIVTYQCARCELTQELSGCGICGPPGTLGPSGDGTAPIGLCNGGTHLCEAYREVSDRRVTLDFVDRRDRRYHDLIERLSAAVDAREV